MDYFLISLSWVSHGCRGAIVQKNDQVAESTANHRPRFGRVSLFTITNSHDSGCTETNQDQDVIDHSDSPCQITMHS